MLDAQSKLFECDPITELPQLSYGELIGRLAPSTESVIIRLRSDSLSGLGASFSEASPLAKPQEASTETPQTEPGPPHDLSTLSLQSAESELGIPAEGLTSFEAQGLLDKYSYNELPKRSQISSKFLSYFWGPIPWMIEVAAILSAFVRHWEDFAIILVLLLMNAGVGFWEEYQAGNAIAALKAKRAFHAPVKRDASWSNSPRARVGAGGLDVSLHR